MRETGKEECKMARDCIRDEWLRNSLRHRLSTCIERKKLKERRGDPILEVKR